MSDETDAEVEAIESAEPTIRVDHRKLPRGRRLHRLVHVRTMLAATLRRLEAWPDAELRPADRIAKSRTLIYGASVMGELVKSAEVEERLRLVEELVRAGRH